MAQPGEECGQVIGRPKHVRARQVDDEDHGADERQARRQAPVDENERQRAKGGVRPNVNGDRQQRGRSPVRLAAQQRGDDADAGQPGKEVGADDDQGGWVTDDGGQGPGFSLRLAQRDRGQRAGERAGERQIKGHGADQAEQLAEDQRQEHRPGRQVKQPNDPIIIVGEIEFDGAVHRTMRGRRAGQGQQHLQEVGRKVLIIIMAGQDINRQRCRQDDERKQGAGHGQCLFNLRAPAL